MSDPTFREKLVARFEREFNTRVVSIQTPPQGMSSSVFFVKTADDTEYAIKYGVDAMKDVPALDLISKNHIDIPVPQLFGSFLLEDVPVIILEKVRFPLLESVSQEEMSKYVPSMIENLRKLHSIKSVFPGKIDESDSTKTWKEILLGIFENDEFDWDEIAHREGLDKNLILTSVQRMKEKINGTVFEDTEYSLLHTDFNQRNLFVNPKNHEIAGIIDWEEAIYGDPIYDFARVHLFLLHFNLGEQVLREYYDRIHFTLEQKKLEDVYLLSYVIQYLAWYSEELTEFNIGRIKLHQDYLRAYEW